MEAASAKLRPVRTKLYKTLNKSTDPNYSVKLYDGGVKDDVHGDNDAGACDTHEPVTPAGRVFCSPSFNVHILVILGFKSPINIEVFKTGIHDTLLKHKRFSSVIRKGDKGDLYWVPTTVNLDDHMVIVGADDADASSPSFVEDYVAKLAQAPPLDTSRPLFEIHILRVKLEDAVENLVLRVHHSLGDGTSLMSLLLACTRKANQPDSLPTLPAQSHRSRRTRTSYEAFFLLLWSFLLIVWYTFLDICSFTATMLWLKDSQTPIMGHAGVEKSPRRLAHWTVSMDDIRSVKNAIHGTVNDVVFGLIAAGLSRYLQQQYSGNLGNSDEAATLKLVGSKHTNDSHKANSDSIKMQLARLRVRACTLVNTRPSSGLHELESMMQGGSQARWGNDMGYVILPVPVSPCENPLEYVYKAKSIIDKKKLSLGAAFSYRSGTMLMNLTGPEMPTRLTYNCTSHTTLAFSNVFGPLEEIQFFGHRVAHIIPTVTGQPQALCVHAQSYMGKITFVVSSVEDIIPYPEILCKHMACALEDMKQKLSNEKIPSRVANGDY
eukprot:c18476_g1_i1 orf=277-1923(-)